MHCWKYLRSYVHQWQLFVRQKDSKRCIPSLITQRIYYCAVSRSKGLQIADRCYELDIQLPVFWYKLERNNTYTYALVSLYHESWTSNNSFLTLSLHFNFSNSLYRWFSCLPIKLTWVSYQLTYQSNQFRDSFHLFCVRFLLNLRSLNLNDYTFKLH